MLFDLKWLLQRRDQPFGQTSCAAGLRLKTLNDAKLITANSRYKCGLFYNCFDSSRDLYQQSITNRVPKKVVHFLEAVEIKTQNCDRSIFLACLLD